MVFGRQKRHPTGAVPLRTTDVDPPDPALRMRVRMTIAPAETGTPMVQEPGPGDGRSNVIALTVSLPLIVLWTNAIALVGGMVASDLQLGIGYAYFVRNLPTAVPIANFWLGIAKGAVFGFFVALIACHFGLRILPNTESLGLGTTNSVVTTITAVILVDALFAIDDEALFTYRQQFHRLHPFRIPEK